MAVKDILPTTNLSWDDIRDTLNANGGKVTNDVGSAFRESANINPWSKYKPVVYNRMFCQAFNPSGSDYHPDWYKGTAGMCGLEVSPALHYNNIPDLMDGDMNGWAYALPKGTEGAPYRLGDFAGYYPKAEPLFKNFNVSERVQNQFPSDEMMGSILVPAHSDDRNIGFSDFAYLKDYHFGMYIRHDASGRSERVVSGPTIGDGNGLLARLNVYGLPVGMYTAYPFIALNPMEQDSMDIANSYYTIPCVAPKKFEIIRNYSSVSVTARMSRLLRQVSYEIYFNNGHGQTMNLTVNYIMLRFNDKDEYDNMVIGEQQVNLGDWTVQKGENRKSGVFENVDDRMLKQGAWVLVTLDTAKYKARTQVLMEVGPPEEIK